MNVDKVKLGHEIAFAIKAIDGWGGFWHVTVRSSNEDGSVDFVAMSDGEATVTYAMLDALARAFATNRINLGSELERTGYCSSCAGEQANLAVAVSGARKP
jgi:hypothetical protein